MHKFITLWHALVAYLTPGVALDAHGEDSAKARLAARGVHFH